MMRSGRKTCSTLLFRGAIVLTAASAAFAVAQSPETPPLDALDDAAWFRAFVDSAHGDDDPCFAALEGQNVDETLALLLVLPASDAPEAYLPLLAALAAGDDPDLAPAAARSARLIVEELSASGLASREASLDDEVTTGFRAVAEDGTARSDVQDTATYIVARLGELERAEVP